MEQAHYAWSTKFNKEAMTFGFVYITYGYAMPMHV